MEKWFHTIQENYKSALIKLGKPNGDLLEILQNSNSI